MTPEATESLKNSQRPTKACVEKPVQVWWHPPQTVYPNIPKAETHQAKAIVSALPTIPALILYTTTQLTKAWSPRTRADIQAITPVCSWLCKNLCNENWNGKLKWNGINHRATKPVLSATSSGCPMNFNIGVANMNNGNSNTAQKNRTIQDLCM